MSGYRALKANNRTLQFVPKHEQIEVSPLSLKNSLKTSKRLLNAAKADAEIILEHARSEQERIFSEAQMHGTANAADALAAKIIDLEKRWYMLRMDAEKELLHIVIMIAEEVLGEALEIQPGAIVSRINRAITQSRLAKPYTIFLHPSQIDILKDKQMVTQRSIVVEADANLELGNFRIESRFGTVVSSLETHLEALRDCLKLTFGKD